MFIVTKIFGIVCTPCPACFSVLFSTCSWPPWQVPLKSENCGTSVLERSTDHLWPVFSFCRHGNRLREVLEVAQCFTANPWQSQAMGRRSFSCACPTAVLSLFLPYSWTDITLHQFWPCTALIPSACFLESRSWVILIIVSPSSSLLLLMLPLCKVDKGTKPLHKQSYLLSPLYGARTPVPHIWVMVTSPSTRMTLCCR